jgi:hypothetical protein
MLVAKNDLHCVLGEQFENGALYAAGQQLVTITAQQARQRAQGVIFIIEHQQQVPGVPPRDRRHGTGTL